MGAPAWLPPLQALIDNRLPDTARAGFIGLIGDHPSTYARSPRMWALALDALGIDASYLPLDVPADRLAAVVAVLRRSDGCLGANVTVPYKEPVALLLDDVDATATAAGAVNTIVRTAHGRLVGSNTDGVGLITALTDPGEGHPLVERLEGTTALLIGAGGAARAAAVALAPLLGSGELLVTNRGHDRAQAVAVLARARGARARAVIDEKLDAVLPGVGLVINASLRGQAGIHRTAPQGQPLRGPSPRGWTVLEPYSALAPAQTAVLAAARKEDVLALWEKRSARDVEVNHSISRARIRLLPRDAVVYDMIYAPPETVTLRHAREAGLRAANGRVMNIAQGVAACVDHICRRHLAERGADLEAVRAMVSGLMTEAWDA